MTLSKTSAGMHGQKQEYHCDRADNSMVSTLASSTRHYLRNSGGAELGARPRLPRSRRDGTERGWLRSEGWHTQQTHECKPRWLREATTLDRNTHAQGGDPWPCRPGA